HDKSSRRMPRTVRSIEVGDDGMVRIVGDGFARYMIRYLVGGAVAASPDEYLRAIAEAVPFQGVRAPAQGLTLWEVRYRPEMDPFSASDRMQLLDGPPFD